MTRRELLTSAQREELLAFPTEEVDLIRHYTFSAHDLSDAKLFANRSALFANDAESAMIACSLL
jgi:Domain of unknown function (DUF4158)